ncbi:hypothetical protein [Parapedobacter indicus]|uniref:Uncharacterized protein n=1 Tax=Parapedobacter indicus TaxID=1477437 RepID=A0A1I3H1V5_9SPHI|nr:hypothetical protein [Parapedobacter indicus]PPL02865.1 hypothetical protein CLV26_103191 [Parapedobacter indicus]SFI29552.1 hypothetical protein SAMN05444682_103190 [Parapedobacter indicus]
MTKTYTSKHASQDIIRKLERDAIRLDLDDELFYDFLKSDMNALLRQPRSSSIHRIISYSKAGQVSLM